MMVVTNMDALNAQVKGIKTARSIPSKKEEKETDEDEGE